MSFTLGADGEVEFVCQGCDAKGKSRSIGSLPKGWCQSGVMVVSMDDHAVDHAEVAEAGQRLAAHFCSVKCGKKKLKEPSVVALVKKLGIVLVLYARCVLILDGSHKDEDDGPPPRRGSRDDEPEPDEDPLRPRGTGSPPPFTMPDGGSPF